MTQTLQRIVATEIKAWMARRGYTQADLAKAIDVDQSGVSNRLNGKTELTIEELGKWAELLNVAPSELMQAVTDNDGIPVLSERRKRASYGWRQRRIPRPHIVPPPGVSEARDPLAA